MDGRHHRVVRMVIRVVQVYVWVQVRVWVRV